MPLNRPPSLFPIGLILCRARVRRPCRPRRAAGQRATASPRWAPPPAGLRRRVTGSFVDRPGRAPTLGRPSPSPPPSPLACGAASRSSPRLVARPLDAHPRRHRRPRAVGQHVRVLGRLRDRDRRRLPVPGAPLPDPLHRASCRWAWRSRCCCTRRSLPSEHRAARAGPPNAPLLTIHVGDGHAQLRDLRDVVRGRGRLPGAGPERPFRVAAVAQGARRGRLPRRHHRLPDLRHDDHPRLVVGVDRLVAATGAGTPRRPRPS